MNPETTPERGKGDSSITRAVDDSNERWRRTAIAAFYRAEARGFAPGGELADWLAAEREVGSQQTETAAIDAEPDALTTSAEPDTQVTAARATGRAAKGAGRGRKSERSTGRNIGGMA